MPIHILPDDLASKIAAGEVIERPASVVKELIENSIDAHAREIKLEIRGGGQRLIRVVDDGDGIPAAEVATAFARHATSKLSSADDLFRLQTLGFRGEALPSIAAVARVTLVTRAREEEVGSSIRVDGGQILSQQPHGSPVGTIVTVEDLFQHVPARLKFLRAPTAETAQVAELVGAYALAYPHLRFSLLNEGRLSFQTNGTGQLRDVLVKVFGIEVARQMIAVGNQAEVEGRGKDEHLELGRAEVGVRGYVSPPSLNRSTRKYVFMFVNGRWIEDRSLAHAVTQAYHTLLMVGRFPIAVLCISLPPDMVDVNVHPAKSQVRFRDPGSIYHAVQRTVRAALMQFAPVPSVAVPPLSPRELEQHQQWLDAGHSQAALDLTSPRPVEPQIAPQGPSSDSRAMASGPIAPLAAADGRLPMLRVLGQVGSTYILSEGPDGMYIIDQHAAHERVLFDKLRSSLDNHQVISQALLEPVQVELTAQQWAAYECERERLRQVGFLLEEFGGSSVLIRALPAVLKSAEPRRAIGEILDEVGVGNEPIERQAEGRLITSICKSAAIKGGQVLALDEMRELVRQLEQTTSPRTCPHGRPTAIRFDLSLLEREFGRK